MSALVDNWEDLFPDEPIVAPVIETLPVVEKLPALLPANPSSAVDKQIYSNPKTISLPKDDAETDKHLLHWVDQKDEQTFSVILKKMTTPLSFDIRDLWLTEKAKLVSRDKPVKHGKAKSAPVAKKADLFKAQNLSKITDKLTQIDQNLLETSLSVTLPSKNKHTFEEYKKMITRLKTPSKQFEMKFGIFKFLIDRLSSVKTQDLKNLVDIYFEMLSYPEPTKEVTQFIKKCQLMFEQMKLDLLTFQMSELSDRLPPLSNFSTNPIKLDQWQMEVLDLIDRKESVIVSAPTSAGKTVISSYAASIGRKVIFVAPSEPLANQVGGLFRDILGGQVEIVTNNFHLNVPSAKVIVGTPLALESCLIDGHFIPEYAIFDEIHELNGPEGSAFERLIKLMNCPALYLSATIGNLPQIQSWMTQLGSGHPVKVIDYKRRFVNLQRHLWTEGTLRHLHPLATLTSADFCQVDINNREFAFTPSDCHRLWVELSQSFGPKNELSGEMDVNYLKLAPDTFFTPGQRLTLDDCYQYSVALIGYIHSLALKSPAQVEKILTALKAQYQEQSTSVADLYNLSMHLKKHNMIPAIFFQMNSSNCEEMYQKMIVYAEQQQDLYVPYYQELLELRQQQYTDYEKQIESFDKDTKITEEQAKPLIEKMTQSFLSKSILAVEEYLNRLHSKLTKQYKEDPQLCQVILKFIETEKLDNLSRKSIDWVDVYQPHPHFCFSTQYISDQLVADIKASIQKELKLRLKWDGWFLRGISRGLGVYLDNVPSAYQRAVQLLAQERKLAVVISDKSLAYGVNLPIKSSCLIGYNQTTQFDPLIAQQMFGRAGRRGYDKEGHVIFVNVNVQEVMQGKLSHISGNHPETPAIATYHQISPFVTEKRMRALLQTDLVDYLQSNVLREQVELYQSSNEFIQQLQMTTEMKLLFWALRQYGNSAKQFMVELPQIETNLHTDLQKQFPTIVLPTIEKNLKELLKKQFPILLANFKQLLGIFLIEGKQNHDAVEAFIEFRISETNSIEEQHQVKNTLIFIGTIIQIIFNYLSINDSCLYTKIVCDLIFNRIRDLMSKYTF